MDKTKRRNISNGVKNEVARRRFCTEGPKRWGQRGYLANAEMVDRILRLRSEDKSIRQIAVETGISRAAVGRLVKPARPATPQLKTPTGKTENLE